MLRGFTWLDVLACAVVVALAIRGLYRGMIAQAFGLIGIVVGLVAATWVSQWVGMHWQGARPAVVFLALRWLVVLLAAFAAAGIFQWWGSMLGEAVREGPFGWLDRSAGVAIGAGIGLAVSAALLLALLLAPWPRTLGDQAAHARLSAPLMRAGARAAEFATRWIPGGAAVRDGFVAAERRTRK